ncbi:MAG: recombination protein O N-terminal domain-containing protein [Minisyncoccia bacterium]
MSYQHYTTEGVILKRENRGENDAVYIIFTEMFGLVVAHASGIRLLKSKLRFVLQLGNRVCITFVRGKVLWRITTCTLVFNPPRPMYTVFTRIYKLLRAHLVFDEPVPHIYDHMRAFLLIDQNVCVQPTLLRTAEIVTMARILSSLGMLDHAQTQLDEHSVLSSEFCESYEKESQTLLRHIKERLNESTL